VIGYKGLLDTLQIFDLQAKALDALRVLLHQSLGMDMRLHKEMGFRRPHNSPLSIFIMHLPYALMATETDDVSQIRGFISILVQDILSFSKDEPDETRRVREQNLALYRLTARFTTLCYQTDWKSKSAGFTGLGLMTNSAEVGLRLTLEREIEVVRALLFVLKDMPQDTPRNSEEIFVIMSRVIETGSNIAPVAETQEITTGKLLLLTTILLQELPSQHSAVRSTAQRCLIRLAECYGKTLYELLSPYKDRLLTSLYGKPLRALPLASQIGYIDAMTYCLSMHPPLAEINEDFTRMLQEVLGMAMGDNDLEDEIIGPAGTRTVYRQNILTNNELRVAYIKFFNAALPITDLFSKQPSIRQRCVPYDFGVCRVLTA
jgi:transformation/transcription domain-associated protein